MKKIMLLVGLLVIGLFVSGCIESPETISPKKEECPTAISSTSNLFFEKHNSPFDRHDGLYPSIEGMISNPPHISRWSDGQQVNNLNYPYTLCSKGSQEGQNINYYYCNGAVYTITNEMELSPEGEILETETKEEYSVSFIVEEILDSCERSTFDSATEFCEYSIISVGCSKEE